MRPQQKRKLIALALFAATECTPDANVAMKFAEHYCGTPGVAAVDIIGGGSSTVRIVCKDGRQWNGPVQEPSSGKDQVGQ